MLIDERELLNKEQVRLYMRGLQTAVEVGSVSCMMLQKKFNVEHRTAFEMLTWMIQQGFVKNDSGTDQFKTTVMTKAEFDEYAKAQGFSTKKKRSRAVMVNDPLYKASLRWMLRQNKISIEVLKQGLMVSNTKAQKIMSRMREDGYIRHVFPSGEVKIMLTREKYKELYEEDV